MPEELNGAPAASPPATNQPGATDPGATGGTPPATPPGEKPSEPGSDTTDFIEKDGVKYYKSFDTHPEWRGLKDGSDALKGVMEEHGFSDASDITSALKAGYSIQELLGTADPVKVQEFMDKVQEHDLWVQHWAEQEETKKREGETLEETVTRLEKDLKAEKEARRIDAETWQESSENTRKLRDFNSTLSNLASVVEISDSAKETLGLLLGINNPMDEVDIGDLKTVRATAKDIISKFAEFVKSERQAAVDEYAKGKSPVTLTPPPAGDRAESVQKRVSVEGKNDQEAFGEATNLFTESLAKIFQNQNQ